MANKQSIEIYVPSYKRADKILTYHLFEHCKYLVRKSEAEEYIKNGIDKNDIWAVDDELINSGSKAYFYIINNAKEDVFVIADDDIEDMRYLIDNVVPINKDKETITDEIYRIGQLMLDLKIGFGYVGPNAIPYNYDREFCWKQIPGAIKWFNREYFQATLDDRVSENFDVDLVLQELAVNRITLSPKYLYDKGVIDKNAGGNSARKHKEQLASITNMKAKNTNGAHKATKFYNELHGIKLACRAMGIEVTYSMNPYFYEDREPSTFTLERLEQEATQQ